MFQAPTLGRMELFLFLSLIGVIAVSALVVALRTRTAPPLPPADDLPDSPSRYRGGTTPGA
ncbi:hypothetical protein Axi01nite_19140 [Actinoplanes xinjiangensis]|nr:hypothetical protein Axi01nite_19140 [Actinoplanes xinjiangensis]